MRLLCLIVLSVCYAQKISLTPAAATDVFAYSKNSLVAGLLDEQAIAGDPKSGSGGKPVLPWDPGYGAEWYPVTNAAVPGPQAAIDLGSSHVLTDIYIYFGQVQGSYSLMWTVSAENPLVADRKWTMPVSSSMSGWTKIALSDTARYITVALSAPTKGSVLELVVYGAGTGEQPQENQVPVRETRAPVKMGLLMGTNGFPWSPSHMDKFVGSFGAIREYQDWSYSEGGPGNKQYKGYPNNQNGFQCTTGGGWCLDTLYSNATNDWNLEWHQDLLNVPLWVHGFNASQENWKSLTLAQMNQPGVSVNPASYFVQADHVWQAAARWGTTKVDDSLLKLFPTTLPWSKIPQPRVSGAGTLKWMETLNEPDKWWKDRNTFYSGIEQAAAQSAFYDGHCGSMAKTQGIRTADKNMKVALGALCIEQNFLDRFQTMLWWSKAFRSDKQFPMDALNVHIYANDSPNLNKPPTTGVSPEEYGLEEQLKGLSAWRDKNVPSVELWLTEYGYDTNPGSPQHSPAIGPHSGEVVQGQWLMRTVLACAAAGLDRAHQFMMADVTTGSNGLYGTSGFLTNPGFSPKPSWYMWRCMFTAIKDFTFVSKECADQVCVSEFSGPSGAKAYAAWAPSANNTVVSGHKVTVSFSGSASLHVPSSTADCKPSSVPVSGGAVVVDVSETPAFIVSA